MSARPDEALMLAYQRGERGAFEELYGRYAKPLYNFFRRAGQLEAAEDLVQATFLKLHIGRQRYAPTGPFRGWIFVLARNVMRDEARRRTRRLERLEPFVDDSTPGQVCEGRGEARGKEAEIMVVEALATLPLSQREVVVLNRYHGMSYAEIGRLLGISENAVKQRAFQAMRRLRRHLSPIGGTPSKS